MSNSKMFSSRILFFLMMTVIVFACSKFETETELKTFAEQNDEGNLKSALASTNIIVDLSDKKAISPQLYGVNNQWDSIHSYKFNTFINQLKNINYSLIRFPGGWESEHYDWSKNINTKNPQATQGASIHQVKIALGQNHDNRPKLSIVVPTELAMREKQWSNAWYANIQKCKREAEDAIILSGANNILNVEIGNEWWLQWAGEKCGKPDDPQYAATYEECRKRKLGKYAHTARRIAQHIATKFPNANFNLLVNGDYTRPHEFTKIKNVFGDKINIIDGVALHAYAGYNTNTHYIPNLVNLITQCKNNLGKDYVSLSEWAPSKAYNQDKRFAEAANILVEQLYEFARAGANDAAFWSPRNDDIWGLGLFDRNFNIQWPTAQLLGDMAVSFRGEVLGVQDGSMRGVASKLNNGNIVVYVVGKDKPMTNVNVRFIDGNEKINKVVSSTLWEPGNAQQTGMARKMKITNNPSNTISPDRKNVSFNVNQNSQYSIYKIELELQ